MSSVEIRELQLILDDAEKRLLRHELTNLRHEGTYSFTQIMEERQYVEYLKGKLDHLMRTQQMYQSMYQPMYQQATYAPSAPSVPSSPPSYSSSPSSSSTIDIRELLMQVMRSNQEEKKAKEEENPNMWNGRPIPEEWLRIPRDQWGYYV